MIKFLQKLQNSDEDSKRRWMVVLTVVAMIIVIYVWLAYFNSLIADISAPQREFAAGVQEEGASTALSVNGSTSLTAGGFGFWQSTKNGLGLVYNGFLGKLRWFGEVLGEPREYIIPPSGKL